MMMVLRPRVSSANKAKDNSASDPKKRDDASPDSSTDYDSRMGRVGLRVNSTNLLPVHE
jgi:hypothetical protein